MTVKDHDSVKQLFQLSKSMKEHAMGVSRSSGGHSSTRPQYRKNCSLDWPFSAWRPAVQPSGRRRFLVRGVLRSCRPINQSNCELTLIVEPPEFDRTATLHGRDIQRIIEENQGVLYSLNGVYQLLHRLGYFSASS